MITANIPTMSFLLLIAVAFCVIYFPLLLLVNGLYDQAAHRPKRKRHGSLDFETPPPYAPLPKAPTEILALTHDRATAYRLFEEVQDRHPNRSEQWIWEKVRWDIERDRK